MLTSPAPLAPPASLTIERDEWFSHTVEITDAFGEIVIQRVVDEDGRQIEVETWTLTNAQAEELGRMLIETARRGRQ